MVNLIFETFFRASQHFRRQQAFDPPEIKSAAANITPCRGSEILQNPVYCVADQDATAISPPSIPTFALQKKTAPRNTGFSPIITSGITKRTGPAPAYGPMDHCHQEAQGIIPGKSGRRSKRFWRTTFLPGKSPPKYTTVIPCFPA